jgi:CheY-specific phosphatase CheX
VNTSRSLARLRLAPAVLLTVVLTLVFVLTPATPVRAATITVPAGDAAALIAAINTANASAGADTIELGGGTYTLTEQRTPCGDPSGLPVITSAITINGNGATIQRDPTVLDGVSPLRFRVMALASGADVTLNNLTIAHGLATYRPDPNGGIKGRRPNKPGSSNGVRQAGRLPVERAGVRSQVPADAVCEFQSNATGRPSFGANIVVGSGATLVLNTVTIRDGNAASGGGIGNIGTLTVNDSTFLDNNAIFDGGALINSNGATATINRTSASGSETRSSGGAFWNQGTLTLNETDVHGNQSYGGGGGIVNDFTGTLTVNNSTVRANIANYLGQPESTGSGGGGIANFRGVVTISGSTIAGNDTGYAEAGGGGIGNFGGTMTIVNSTVYGNAAVQNGGGVFVGRDPAYPDLPNGTLTIRSSTISNNEIQSYGRRRDNNFPPVILTFIPEGGGVYAASGASATVHNTIIAGNRALAGDYNGTPIAASTSVDVAGTFNASYNLVGDATGATGFAGNGNQAGTGAAPIDPRLGLLDANGGPTATTPPLAGSPALGAGNPAAPGTAVDVCPIADQRGISRVGKPCDVGSVQVSVAPDTTPPTVTVTAPSAPAGQGGFFNAADGPVTVNVSATDASGVSSLSCTVNGTATTVGSQSGSSPRTGSFTLSGSGTYAIACSATDSRGNSGAAGGSANTATVKIDADAPTISSAITPASPASSGWYNSSTGAPTVSFTCNDTGGSGLAGTCPAPVTLGEGANQTVSRTVADVAGNTSAAATRSGMNVDLTAPTVTVTAPSAPAGQGGFFNAADGPVTVQVSATDTNNVANLTCTVNGSPIVVGGQSGLNPRTGSFTLSGSGTYAIACSATDAPGNSGAAGGSANTATVKIDADAPTISSAITPANPASSGWYNSSTGAPTVSFTCNDTGGSGLAGTCPAPVTLGEGANQSVSRTVADVAGNTSAAATRSGINVDLTAPTLAPVVAPNPVLLNGSATVTPNAGDTLSGLADVSCGALVTSSVGAKSVSCSATDEAGNSATASANYNVAFQFSGFRQPVDNLPIVNVANAGRNLPLKFRITDANGQPVANLTTVRLAAPVFACGTGAPTDVIEEYVDIDSGLKYLGNGEYQYNWKTLKSYAGTCRTLKLDLGEGTGLERTALFQFR